MAKRPKRMATFRLSEATLAAIKQLAEEREMSQAEVVEAAVRLMQGAALREQAA